jgi:carbamate kinase
VKGRTVLVAFGGNALLKEGEEATQRQQIHRAEELARFLARVVKNGAKLILVHGNGPQVGDALIRVEQAVHRAPPLSLDFCVAETQGSIGFLLERALRNALARGRGRRSRAPEPVTLMTQVVVRKNDPRLRRPSKPIGPWYPRYRAEDLKKRLKWKMVEQKGTGFRRLVASPRPVEVLGIEPIRRLLQAGRVVIAAGGGGVPVFRSRKGLQGIEAVVDKDRTASLLGRELDVDLFAIITNVDGVYEKWGTPEARRIPRLSVKEARAGLASGEFPRGSMGPKVEAAADFAEATGRPVLITDAKRFAAGIAGRAGTRVVA